MKQNVAASKMKPNQIATECTKECDNTARAMLPSVAVCKQITCNQRLMPPNPRRLRELGELPDECRTTTHREHFMLNDNAQTDMTEFLLL
uniref:Uncharacterized protein n=1 Tax=Octopus bimaculoides TaxID=37653 RepID=A0A0L8GRY9_OCTBM